MVWRPNVTVAAVIERDARFLMVEEEDNGSVVLNQPAGHLDEGESLITAVVRETREETAWDIEPSSLIGVYRWPHPVSEITYLRFAFAAKAIRHHPDDPLDTGIRRALWMTRDELKQEQSRLRSPQVLRCVDDYLKGQHHPLSILIDIGA